MTLRPTGESPFVGRSFPHLLKHPQQQQRSLGLAQRIRLGSQQTFPSGGHLGDRAPTGFPSQANEGHGLRISQGLALPIPKLLESIHSTGEEQRTGEPTRQFTGVLGGQFTQEDDIRIVMSHMVQKTGKTHCILGIGPRSFQQIYPAGVSEMNIIRLPLCGSCEDFQSPLTGFQTRRIIGQRGSPGRHRICQLSRHARRTCGPDQRPGLKLVEKTDPIRRINFRGGNHEQRNHHQNDGRHKEGDRHRRQTKPTIAYQNPQQAIVDRLEGRFVGVRRLRIRRGSRGVRCPGGHS